jgi:hypothetical protein
MLPISPTNRPTEKRRQKKVLLQLWPRADAGPFKPLPNDESGFPAGPGKAQCRGVRDPQGATDSGNPNPARGRPAASRDRHPEGQRLSAENAKRVILALIVFTAIWIAFLAALVRLILFRPSVV